MNFARLHQLRSFKVLLSLFFSALPFYTLALNYQSGDLSAQINTTLTVGSSMRVQDPSPYQVGLADGGLGASFNTEDGNLNFDQGDFYSLLFKGITDVRLQYKDYGLFTRAKYWYDHKRKDLDKKQRGTLRADSKIDHYDFEILDAYLWKDFWFDESELTVRLGQQVVNWGEGTFIFNGINVINPVDLVSLYSPSTEVKDALKPVNMVFISSSVNENLSIEAFYQLKHEAITLDDCGAFFSTVDYVTDHCNPIYLHPLDLSVNFPRAQDKNVKDDGQFGVALKWFAPNLNESEFGLYYMNYHSRFPFVSGTLPANPLDPFNTSNGVNYFIEYPEDIQLIGLSFNTQGPWGSSLSGEYSFKKNAPLQFNAFDLLQAALSQPLSPVFQTRVPDVTGDGIIDTTDAFLSGFYGQSEEGYDHYDVSQLQFTLINFFNKVLGAERLTLVSEIGGTYVHSLPDADEGGIRYGRNENMGFGLTSAGFAACNAVNTFGDATRLCNTEGYVTEFSWGYRALLALEYNNVFRGTSLTPQIAWSHDVQGYAPEPGGNFIEDRKSIGLSLAINYLDEIEGLISYTVYTGAKLHNALVDRDNVSVSASYSF